MAYTLLAIVGSATEMAKAQPDDLTTVPLSAGLAMWPIDSTFQEKYGVPFLPLTDEGQSNVPPTIAAVASVLSRCAYIEAELFGSDGTQASAVYEGGKQIGKVVVAVSAINNALRKLGVQASRGRDEFDTVGLGAERHTDAWKTHLAEPGAPSNNQGLDA